jgi:hypothetical protein
LREVYGSIAAEAFNLPNHPNFSTPVATINSGAFGQIQSDISGTSGLTAGDPPILGSQGANYQST